MWIEHGTNYAEQESRNDVSDRESSPCSELAFTETSQAATPPDVSPLATLELDDSDQEGDGMCSLQHFQCMW